MKISEAAEQSGLPAKTIRYYEDIGLIQPERRKNGYREYTQSDLHRLRFLQRARSLGFSVQDCRSLLTPYADPNRSSASVKAIAEAHLCKMEHKVRELATLLDALSELVKACHGDERPDCPILEDLAGEAAAPMN